MEEMISVGMVLLFLNSLWWIVADITGNFMMKLLLKVIGIVGAVIPVIYFLKLWEII